MSVRFNGAIEERDITGWSDLSTSSDRYREQVYEHVMPAGWSWVVAGTVMLVVCVGRGPEGNRGTETNEAQSQVVIDQMSNGAVSCDSEGMADPWTIDEVASKDMVRLDAQAGSGKAARKRRVWRKDNPGPKGSMAPPFAGILVCAASLVDLSFALSN